MIRLHIHWPRHSEHHGANVYQICRCGARRVRRVGPGLSPIAEGWPNTRAGWVAATCSTCGGSFDSPPCSLSRDIGWSGHTRDGGVAAVCNCTWNSGDGRPHGAACPAAPSLSDATRAAETNESGTP